MGKDNEELKNDLRDGSAQFASAATTLQEIEDVILQVIADLAPSSQKWIGPASDASNKAHTHLTGYTTTGKQVLQNTSQELISLVQAIEDAEKEAEQDAKKEAIANDVILVLGVVLLPIAVEAVGGALADKAVTSALQKAIELLQAADQKIAGLFDAFRLLAKNLPKLTRDIEDVKEIPVVEEAPVPTKAPQISPNPVPAKPPAKPASGSGGDATGPGTPEILNTPPHENPVPQPDEPPPPYKVSFPGEDPPPYSGDVQPPPAGADQPPPRNNGFQPPRSGEGGPPPNNIPHPNGPEEDDVKILHDDNDVTIFGHPDGTTTSAIHNPDGSVTITDIDASGNEINTIHVPADEEPYDPSIFDAYAEPYDPSIFDDYLTRAITERYTFGDTMVTTYDDGSQKIETFLRDKGILAVLTIDPAGNEQMHYVLPRRPLDNETPIIIVTEPH